jgi:hypothetical protein
MAETQARTAKAGTKETPAAVVAQGATDGTQAPAAGNGKKSATPVNTIRMTDGRPVDFPGKRRLQKSWTVNQNGKVQVLLDFVNGETRTFVVPDSLINDFIGHGAEQKLGDEMAGIDDLDDAILAVDTLIENLNKGEWRQKGDASGMAGTSILLKAMVEYTGKTTELVKEFLKDKTPAEKAALKTSKIPNKAGMTIKQIADRLEEEKVAKGSKTDAATLLASFAV